MTWTRNFWIAITLVLFADIALATFSVRILVASTTSKALLAEDGLVIPRGEQSPEYGPTRPIMLTNCHYWLGYRVLREPPPRGATGCPLITR